MRSIIRRVGQLEEKLTSPRVGPAIQRAVEIPDERRRRRSFLPEPLEWASLNLPPGTRVSHRETLRLGLDLQRKRDRESREAASKEGQIGAHDISAA
jgi:hypothetical protein